MIKVLGPVFVGIDVSACTLGVALERDPQPDRQRREFPNSAAGHKVLVQWLSKSAAAVQVCLEATALYSLDLAIGLKGSRSWFQTHALLLTSPKPCCSAARPTSS